MVIFARSGSSFPAHPTSSPVLTHRRPARAPPTPRTSWPDLHFSRCTLLNEDQLRTIRILLGTLLLIRQPADTRRALWQSEQVRPDATARKRLRRAGAEHPDAPVRYITLRQSIRPASDDDRGARDTAGRIYRHQWFVRPHRRTYPDQDDPTGYSRKWVGPYLITPEGCKDAPILGRERVVSVLRR
ncbi:hypothetical protein [Streptomyces sp. NPDC048411]|uniref:hypothetical protein n=1 Tax=unclassified Streptomyces TaxID=2593676 RepID=UPI003455BEB5